MEPIYDQTKKHLTIEWMESKKNESPSHRFFSKKPIKLQMHPKLADKLIRAYFKGAMPSWIKRYAETHNFEVKQVKHEGKDGWWIAKWAGFEGNPFSSPTVKGAVRQFSKMIPFVCEDLREKVIDNLDIIEQNLSIDPSHFHGFGLYFRPEEINKEGGCLLLEEDVIPERDQEEDEDYRNLIEAHGKLADLVWEITNPLSKELEVSDEELVNDIELNEEEDEEVLINKSDEIIIDLEEIKVEVPVLEETEEITEEVPLEITAVGETEEITEEIPLEITAVEETEEITKEVPLEITAVEETEEVPLEITTVEETEEIIEEVPLEITTVEETEEIIEEVSLEITAVEEAEEIMEEVLLEITEESGNEIEDSLLEPETDVSEDVSIAALIQKLVPLKNDDKKAGAIAGQMPLF
ncbi:hypothetical protein [Metabacillus fastidiosus]|uniref:Uncharacterized protein n=1 Tax=Metabacillus fastidiosus TaxID=1458 RepID=A0ABU6NSX7_9BACI|nr:hypothetical protein [Metabacillus fastidiosus]